MKSVGIEVRLDAQRLISSWQIRGMPEMVHTDGVTGFKALRMPGELTATDTVWPHGPRPP